MSNQRVLKAIKEYHYDPNWIPDNGQCVFAWGFNIVAGDGKTPLKDLEPIDVKPTDSDFEKIQKFVEANKEEIIKTVEEKLS